MSKAWVYANKTGQHTPGPWRPIRVPEMGSDEAHWTIQGANCEPVASLDYTLGPEGQEEADARLIAAAPELLKAAKYALLRLGLVREFGENAPDDTEPADELRAAIAAAEGR